jgi:hypothetical protein
MAQVKAFTLGSIGAPCCCASGPATVTCTPCNIPAANLTLSYTNVISGNGSTTLTYTTGPNAWTSACTNGLLYKVLCTAGQLELRVIYFTAGSCPAGTQQYCSNLRSSPLTLNFFSHTCSPFSLTFKPSSSGCPTIAGNGYSQFVVTYP